METPEYLDKLFEGISPEKVVFWTGAGISIASPTNLPSGIILTEESMKKIMPDGTYNAVQKIFTSGNFKDAFGIPRKVPRLELIIQTAYGVLGFKTFDFFSFMNIPSKYLNRYHIFFPSHILAGGTHFTMNFDDGIETGIKRIDVNLDPQIYVIDDPNLFNQNKIDFVGKLIKLHGSLTKKEFYSSLGLILNNITSGFDKIHSKKIIKVIRDSKVLCFIGYGGVDSFDVTPFFKKWISETKLNDLIVLWIEYADTPELVPINISETENAGKDILTAFKKAGANVLAFEGNAETELIPFLAQKWNLNLPNVGTEDYHWKNHFDSAFESNPVPNHLKNLIAGQYASALGVGKLAVDFTNPIRKSNLDARPNPADGINISHQNQCWFVYTNGLRDLGEYSKAIKEIKDWKRQVHKKPFNYFLINYRLMGEYRIRRNLLRAFIPYWNAKRLIKKLEKPLFSIDEELEDDMEKRIILEKLEDIFKTKRFQLSGNVRITKEKEKGWVITYEEKFIVRKEDGKLNIYCYLNLDELFFIARFYVDYLHLLKDHWKLFLYRDLCTTKEPSIVFKIISKICKKFIIDAWISAYSYNKKAINNPHIFSDITNLAKNHFKGINYDCFVKSAKEKLHEDFNEDLLQMAIKAFLETDSLLGDINSQRGQIDKNLCKYLHDIGYLFSVKPYYKQSLKDGNVNAKLKKEFEDNKLSLLSKAKISKIDEKHWEIVDDEKRYRIEDTETQLNIYDIGIIDEIKGNLSKARSIWDYPGMWKAYFRLAKVYYALKEFDKASENAQKALDAIDKVSYDFFYKRKYIKQF